MVIGTFDIDTEARAHVVDNKNYAVFVADFAYFLPVSGGGKFVIAEVAVLIGLGNKARNLSVVLFAQRFELLGMIPFDIEVIAYVLFDYARISEFLRPGRYAVIPAFGKHHFFAARIGAGNHHRKLSNVVAVFGEERPVRHVYRAADFFRKLDGNIADKRRAIALFPLGGRRRVDVGVVISEIVGP